MSKIIIICSGVYHQIDSYTPLQSLDSFGMLAIGMKNSFEKLGSEVHIIDPSDIEKPLPKVDFVILILYHGDINDSHIKMIKEKTQCIKVVSLRETSCEFSDYSFLFNDKYNDNNNGKSTMIHLPANKSLLTPSKKIPKTILIDHYWEDFLDSPKDWTFNIENWIEPLVDEGYIFYRMIRFEGEKDTIKSFEIPLPYMSYYEYLEKTKTIETLIITHQESYGFGVIDMACRGTRICSPNSFLHECLTTRLNIPIFNNKEELLSILRSPIEQYWENSISKCTDYDDVAIIINNKFNKWKN